jgi:mono/diheme cytochrome c family protein
MLQKQAKQRHGARLVTVFDRNGGIFVRLLVLLKKGELFMRFDYAKWILPLALAFPLSAAEKGDVAKGKELFANRCAVCHGTAGEGKEAIAKLFQIKMPVLSSKEVQSQNDAALKKMVLEGKGKMKPLVLSDQELEDAIAFLRTLKK